MLWGLSCQQFFSGTARLCIACLCILHTLSLCFGVIEILKSRASLENLNFQLGVDLLMRVIFLKERLSHILPILILKCRIKRISIWGTLIFTFHIIWFKIELPFSQAYLVVLLSKHLQIFQQIEISTYSFSKHTCILIWNLENCNKKGEVRKFSFSGRGGGWFSRYLFFV